MGSEAFELMVSSRFVLVPVMLLILGANGIVGIAAGQLGNDGESEESDAPFQLAVNTEVVARLGTSIDNWCGVTFEFLPDGSIICGELRSGKVRLITNNEMLPEPLIDLDSFSGFKAPGVIDEQGLVGLALDPNFEENHYVYLHWTYRPDASGNQTDTFRQIARFTLTDNKLVDKKILIDGIPGAKQHVGGPLEFGPDGTLYITGGEAGKMKIAQDLDSPLGKVLRIYPDGTIPADNPFPGKPYYTIGHRNVFGLGFHPITGVPYVTENGNLVSDEVNILSPGKNYGWPDVVGNSTDPEFTSPIWHSGPGTIAPTELEFYRGDKYPEEMTNDLFFLAYNPRTLERLELEGPDYDNVGQHHTYQLPLTGMGSYTDIELGPDGYFYVSDFRSISKVLFDYINVTTSIEVEQPPATSTGFATTLRAKIIDYFGEPVVNVPLNFFASGAEIGTAHTNQEGIASLAYSSFEPGEFPIVARFGGDSKYLAGSSAEDVTLVVEGSSVQPPRVLEAMTSNNILVRVSLTSTGGQNDNSTLSFTVRFIDPIADTEIENVPYVVEVKRENTVLYSEAAVSGRPGSTHEITFEELGPAEIVVKEINNSDTSVRYGVTIVPEFPVHGVLVPIMALAMVIALFRYSKSKSPSANAFGT